MAVSGRIMAYQEAISRQQSAWRNVMPRSTLGAPISSNPVSGQFPNCRTIILSDHFPDLDVTQFAHILHIAINLAIEKLHQHWRVRLRLQHVRLAVERAVLGVGQ